MDKIQKILLLSLVSTSALAWVISKDQPDMMKAMITFDPLAILIFTTSWTVGMAAMMFPAISPMVLLYHRLIKKDDCANSNGIYRGKDKVSSSSVVEGKKSESSKISFYVNYSLKIVLFVGCYLAIWALTGVALLLGWSILMNSFIAVGAETKQIDILYGILLIISGAYQFSTLKTNCIGYCESPLSFFMRRWKGGTLGAIKMGTFHGLYCLGCCWPYFLLMISLGWMNLFWMGLFSCLIFAEKIWSRGLLLAKIAGISLMVLGLTAIIFAPNAHNLLRIDGDGSGNEENIKDQSMDMKGMMDMKEKDQSMDMKGMMDTKEKDQSMAINNIAKPLTTTNNITYGTK
jgi:predicted metal-binding membrane protein